MNTRHYISTEDFTKKDYQEIFRRAAIFQKGGDFTHLARGKILGVAFFQESTRTVAVFQAAMIRLGGGWLGIPNPAGSYVAAGEESVEDTLFALAPLTDIMAVRHKNFDLGTIAPRFPIPLVNAMCGGDEHTAAALWEGFMLSQRVRSLENITAGFYGMVKSSRPAKAMIKFLGQFGATIYEDPVIPEFRTPPHIQNYLQKHSAKLIEAPLHEFIDKVDYLSVVEGLPQAGEDETLVKRYNEKFEIFGMQQLKNVRKDAVVLYGEPSMMTDGRQIIKKNEIIDDPRILNAKLMQEAIPTNMALITYLLGIKV